MSGLRVLFPHSGAENPYVELLTAALRAAGVDVRVARQYRHLGLWRAVLRNGRPDVFHLQWHHGYFTARTMLFARINTLLFRLQRATLRAAGVRFVWTVHEIVNHQQWQAAWELAACRQLAGAVDAVVVHSDSAAGIVATECRLPRARLHVTPHGNYIGRYPVIDRAAARARLGIAPDTRQFLFFGAVRRHKGIDALLKAFRAIDDDAARLVILGEPESAELAAGLEAARRDDGRITLHFAYADDALLATHIAACDFVVLPHRSVLTSGSAILAASCARAAVMPALGCMREFPAGTAILFDPAAAAALGTALRTALAASADAMGAAAREYIAPFTWQRTARATIDVYRTVLGGE